MALEDGVKALLLGHRIITNTTVPPMQAPVINFPDTGRHVNFPNKLGWKTNPALLDLLDFVS